MKKTILALSMLTASAAFAGSLNLDMRFDADNASFNTDAGKPGYSKYYMQTGRIDWNGAVNPDLSYRVRMRFAGKDQGNMTTRDATNDTLDLAYLANKMGDITLIAGKFDVGMNGFEGATSSADLYFNSVGYNAGVRYAAGLAGVYTLGDHAITLGHVNYPTDPAGTFDQTRGILALVYKGAFMEKALNVIGSYHTYGIDFGTDKKSTGLMTVGASYNGGVWNATLDYNSFTVPTSKDYNKVTSSIVANAGYMINDMNTVKFKYETSSVKQEAVTATTTNTTGMGLALECKTIKDANFRYHAAYTTVSAKADTTGATTTTENHFILGARLNADFLK